MAGLQDATGGGADVIIDPLWGEPALAAMKAARHGARHIQIGTMAGMDLALPAAAVRSKAIDLLGFAIFHAPLPVRKDADLQMTEHAASGNLTVNLERVPLRDIAAGWDRQKAGAGTNRYSSPENRSAIKGATVIQSAGGGRWRDCDYAVFLNVSVQRRNGG